MSRTVLTWRIDGHDLVGTHHVPAPGPAGAPFAAVLLLNAGPAMRSGNSDLSVRIGERLALRGFPVFRFDLPGLGDSSGVAPVDLDAYWSEVVSGRNDAATEALIERIRLELGVARVLAGGLCAAMVPCVRAAARSSTPPAGLLLLEPELRSVVRNKPGASACAADECASGLLQTLSVLRRSGESRMTRAAQPVRALLRGVLKRPGSAPRGANAALIRSWQESCARGVPSLVVLAAGKTTDLYVTRVLDALPARAARAVSCVRVPGTNHLFTSGAGRGAVLDALERWMVERFGVGMPARAGAGS